MKLSVTVPEVISFMYTFTSTLSLTFQINYPIQISLLEVIP